MQRFTVCGLLAATALCLSAPALAQDHPEAHKPEADTTFSVGTIVVTARGMAGSSANVLTSVDMLGGDVAQNADVDNAFELVGRMPGVQVTDFNQGNTSGKFSLRGFNGEGTINAVKLLVDGVPSNSNDGNMPYIDMVFPLNVGGIEVVRGTSDPRFGLHAIGGSANILTRSGGNYVDARGSIGSYETYEGQLALGLERGKFSQNYMIGYRDGEGYREHGNFDRLSLSGRWGLDLTEDLRLGAIARYYKGNAEEPGYLTFADSRRDPQMTNAYNATDADAREMQQYALTADVTFSNRLDWSSTLYLNRLHDDRYVKFSAGASQQRRLTIEDHYGAMTALHWHGDVAGVPLMLEAGGDVQWQDNQSLRWLSVARVPTSQTRNQQYDLTVGGAYVQAIIEPADWLRITPAYRIDRVGGDFANRLNNTTAPINDYGTIDQPKLSVAVLPLAGLTLYGNWGKTYQIGLGSGAYLIPPRSVDLDPSINEGWELGAKYQAGEVFEGRIAWWQQTASGEIARKLNDPLGDFENVGATRRKGLDVQASVSPVQGISLWGALAWQRAVITVPPAATPQYVGNRIDHTPHWLWSGGVEVQPVAGLTLSFAGRGASRYDLTSANAEGRWGGMTVLDVSALYALTDHLDLGLAVKNLASAYYEYVWWDGAQSLHSPADGRNVSLNIRARY